MKRTEASATHEPLHRLRRSDYARECGDKRHGGLEVRVPPFHFEATSVDVSTTRFSDGLPQFDPPVRERCINLGLGYIACGVGGKHFSGKTTQLSQVLSPISKPPVPVERIAANYGLDIRFAPFDGDISGALIRTERDAYIGVNSSHHPNRQRFTVAHELGHYLLHAGLRFHIDKEFWVKWRDDESSKAVDWEEIEANRFAAELIMPTDFLIKDINRLRRRNRQMMQHLARRYRVSNQAMEIRLTHLGLILRD